MKSDPQFVLITPCLSANPGAILQAWSLSLFLAKQGHQVCLPVPFLKSWPPSEKRTPTKTLLKMLKHRQTEIGLEKSFASFVNRHFDVVYADEIPGSFKPLCSVFGSDQVFSPLFNSNESAKAFSFGKFIQGGKRIAYSVSFGWNFVDLPKDYLSFLATALTHFDFLSTRESEGAKIVEKTRGGVLPPVTLDPTFFFSAREWQELIAKEPGKKTHKFPKNNSYILLFSIGSSDQTIDMAKKLRNEKHLPIVLAFYTGRRFFWGFKEYANLTPLDLITLIQGAAYVVTSSYHGFILSLNFQKEVFYSLSPYSPNSNSRFSDFIETFHLSDHNIQQALAALPAPLDFSKISPLIDEKRELSKNFLLEALRSVSDGSNH